MNFRKLRVPLLRVAFFFFVLSAVLSGPSDEHGLLAHFAFRWAGGLLLMSGLIVRLWSILYIGSRKSHALIKTGPYSISRNPLYVGTFLLTLGTAICFENVTMFLLALVAILPIHVATVFAEEEHLRTIFGDDYTRYCLETPRFLFRLSRYNAGPSVDVSLRALRRAVVDAVGVLMIPPAASLIDVLREHHVLPILWRWP